MFIRAARWYLRTEWVRIAAAVLAAAVYAVITVNSLSSVPMSYQAFLSQYDSYTFSEQYVMEVLSEDLRIPREELGNSFEEAYPAVNAHHFDSFLRQNSERLTFFAVFSGVMAAFFLCILFRKRRLGPLLAAGIPRGTVYLFAGVLYIALFLLVWVIAVPLCLTRYHIPLTGEQQLCLRRLQAVLLLGLLFGAAVTFYFAFLLRRAVLAFPVSAGLLLLLYAAGLPVPVPGEYLNALLAWDPSPGTGPLVLQGCITAAAAAAAAAGGWFCFRRFEQK